MDPGALLAAIGALLAAALGVVALASWRVRRARERRDRAALAESESRHRALVEASPDGIVVLVEGRIVFANPAAARIFGARGPDALAGIAGASLIAPESAPLIAQRNRDVEMRGVATAPVEVRARRLDGSDADIELWGMPVTFAGRQADLSIVRDVTERRAQAVTRDLVRRMLRETAGLARGPTMRALGRRLAADIPATSLDAFLRAYESMGGGRFAVERETQGRFVVRGADLLERRDGATQPTCGLPLGFLEGAVTRLASATALGTETRCQSLGHDACVFIVQARAPVVAATASPDRLANLHNGA